MSYRSRVFGPIVLKEILGGGGGKSQRQVMSHHFGKNLFEIYCELAGSKMCSSKMLDFYLSVIARCFNVNKHFF